MSSLLRQAAQLRATERKVNVLSLKNEQLESMLENYEKDGKVRTYTDDLYDAPFTVENVGPGDATVGLRVIKPGQRRTFPRRASCTN